MKDYYDMMGLAPEASQDEIANMYRKLSKKYHPDKNTDDPDLVRWADGMMKELNEAYDILSDPAKRAQYDQRRRIPQSFRPTAQADAPPQPDITMWKYLVLSGSGLSALSFGLLAIGITKNPLIGIVAAGFGAYLGHKLGATRVNWIFYGMLIGGFLGSLTTIPGPIDFAIGAIVGGYFGFGLSKGR